MNELVTVIRNPLLSVLSNWRYCFIIIIGLTIRIKLHYELMLEYFNFHHDCFLKYLKQKMNQSLNSKVE